MNAPRFNAEATLLRCRRIGHVNIYVADWEGTMAFYRDVCGLEEVFREPPIKAGFLSSGNTHHDIGFLQATGTERVGKDGFVQTKAGIGARPGFNHFGIEMFCEKDLVDGWHRLVAAGIKIEKTTNSSGLSKSVYVRDPDGNLLQFYADLMKDWRDFWGLGPRLVTGPWDPRTEKAPTKDSYFSLAPVRYMSPVSRVHPLRLTGGVLRVSDVQRSAEFYELVGFSEVWRSTDGNTRLLSASGLNRDIRLVQGHSGQEPALTQFSFLIPSREELETARQWLQQIGYAVESYADQGLCLSLCVRDPDDFKVEFYVDKTDDWVNYLQNGGKWNVQ